MKKLSLLCLLFFGLLSSCQNQPAPPAPVKISGKPAGGFAVVELFTSQGCSSCPPADALLGKEIAAYAKAGKKVFALSFHVDYWNRLGWTDPFSQKEFTQRQYGYAAKLQGEGVYTPQAIVNGQQVTVGGNQKKLETFIDQGLKDTPTASVAITAVAVKAESLEVSYEYNGRNADLHIAVVQREVQTPVKAGENDGRTLINFNVVRSWKTIDAKTGSQQVSINLPSGDAADLYQVILYAQEKGNGKVMAADMK